MLENNYMFLDLLVYILPCVCERERELLGDLLVKNAG